VTDQNNLFAMVKFYRAALARGVKPSSVSICSSAKWVSGSSPRG